MNFLDFLTFDRKTMNYEMRIVAYIDIIGWTERTSKSKVDNKIQRAMNIFEQEHYFNSREYKERLRKEADERATIHLIRDFEKVECAIFSDNLVISTPIEFEKNIFVTIGRIRRILLEEGFLTRGGIAIGPLYHEENVILGPALIEAVKLEKEASFPRILCSDSMIRHMRNWPPYPDCPIILIDLLGRTVVNLFPLPFIPDSPESISHIKQHLNYDRIRRIIDLEIAKYSRKDNNSCGRKLEKWRYMDGLLKQAVKSVHGIEEY